jgi:hypothetical protein
MRIDSGSTQGEEGQPSSSRAGPVDCLDSNGWRAGVDRLWGEAGVGHRVASAEDPCSISG